ncbi:MAG: elongation factor P [Arcticibacterium sp.]|jgi:elongation factor P
MSTTADFRNGLCIEYNHGLYIITDFQHVKPGKGPAFVRTKLKNLKTGKVLDNTFTSGVSVVTARVERRKFQFLYSDDIGYHFMNSENFEQINLPQEMVTAYDLLKEGQVVDILIHAEEEIPLIVDMPLYVELRVEYTEPGLKGDTANSPMKPAEVETGATIKVPLFIETDELIKVNTNTYEYDSRVKE